MRSICGPNHGTREENRDKIAQRSESHEKPTLSDQVVSEELAESLRGAARAREGKVCRMWQGRAWIFPDVLGKMGGEIAPKLNLGVGGDMMKETQISQPQRMRDSSHHCWPQVHPSCGVGEGRDG